MKILNVHFFLCMLISTVRNSTIMPPWIESFCKHIVPVMYSFIIIIILSANAAKVAFRDCTESCIFPLEYSISTNNTIDYVSLSSAFQISFDLKLWRSAPQTANIFDIYSLASGISLLSFSLESSTNTLQVYYKGSAVIGLSMAAVFKNPITYSSISIKIDPSSMTLQSGETVVTQLTPQPIVTNTTVFTYGPSNYILSFGGNYAATVFGSARSITINGPVCCSQTSYYLTAWQQCSSALEYGFKTVSGCATCISYQCIDWTFRSTEMQKKELQYLTETKTSVYFAVGSYGNDPKRAGLCYRIKMKGVKNDIVMQVISARGDPNPHIIAGGGQLGLQEACTYSGTTVPQFPGGRGSDSNPTWGDIYVGLNDKASCPYLPSVPLCQPAPPQDTMPILCNMTVWAGLGYKTLIQSFCQVTCPYQLYTATGLRRTDDVTNAQCSAGIPITTGLVLFKYMDCARPTYSNRALIGGPVDPNFQSVTPCRRDGYQRINSLPDRPSLEPTLRPSVKPVPASPTFDSLCCKNSDYYLYDWQYCANPADPANVNVTTCDVCMAYSCVDWLAGSAGMQQREANYLARTGDKVYFGVGSYGSDPTKAGLCYRVTTDTVDRDLIVQVITNGAEDGNLNMYVADGGLGYQDACTFEGSPAPQYYSSVSDWGAQYGGWTDIQSCSKIPKTPVCALNPADNLQDLCRWSFAQKIRLAGQFVASNPTITQMCEVQCPQELWEAVGYRRLDGSNLTSTCPANVGVSPGGQLSRVQDCAKPFYAWGTGKGRFDPSNSKIVTCRRDGYTRINTPTYFPTAIPTPVSMLNDSLPTMVPTTIRTPSPSYAVTTVPSFEPTQAKLCCADTPYADWEWPYCSNAADPLVNANITTCNKCMSYQCLDWLALSKGMQKREEQYYNRTSGDSVYFGVGSYGSDVSRAGLCYRITASGVDRDLIVQVITAGGNTADGNFNLLMADGGFTDTSNACVEEGTSIPQFDGGSIGWGGPKGGWLTPDGCRKLPQYPLCGGTHQDNMQELCYQSFAVGLRLTDYNFSNPVITKMCNVQCPAELWKATGLHRNDEIAQQYTCSANQEPSGGLLSRGMNCAKPSYGWGVPVTAGNTSVGYDRVVPCRRDGYTRVNFVPTARPTPSPTYAPTSNTSLCCTENVYGPSQWPYCTNAADSSLKTTSINSCDTCIAYQCIDWNVLSGGMQQREAIYKQQTNDNVYFGVGSYGADRSKAGLCYRITANGIDRDLIVQVITAGGNSPGGSFNLLMADGGFTDQYTACSKEGTPVPQFAGESQRWGGASGGWKNASGCNNIPEYPICSSVRYDNIRSLCKQTFAKGFRVPNTVRSNPAIKKMCQVKCPDPLWQATGLRRADEKNANYVCGAKLESTGGVLTRSMDCSKPTYAWDGTIVGRTFNDSNRVIPCKRDGYTRVNADPTLMPTAEPTLVQPTPSPTLQPLCCQETGHKGDSWKTCKNAADPSVIAGGAVTNCSTCLAYQCIDWTAGSVGMRERQQKFFERTGIDVNFGVGTYGNDPTRGGKCYRLAVQNTQRDLLVQVISVGSYVNEGNFNLLMGNGGLGSNSACTSGMGANVPQYAGPATSWGTTYNGWGTPADCANLPSYPTCAVNPQDKLSDLCQWGFSNKFRNQLGASPPVIYRMCEVKCPWELYLATGLHRWDESNEEYQCAAGVRIPAPGFLSKYMDCGKPAFAWPQNVRGIGMIDPNLTIVVPCKRDGYTRVNVQPVFPPTDGPTEEPTISPAPTPMPSNGTADATAVQQQKGGSTADTISLSSPKWLSIIGAVALVGMILIIVAMCEVCLRLTWRKELREKIRYSRIQRGQA